MGNVLGFDYDNPFSISLWMNDIGSGTYALVSKQEAVAGYRGYNFYIDGPVGGTAYLKFSLVHDNSPSTMIIVRGTTNLIGIGWSNLIVTYDGSGNASGVKMYINSTLDALDAGVTVDTLGANTTLSAADFNIGSRDGASLDIDAQLTETSIFDYELSATNVVSIYNSGQPEDLTSLSPVAWWRMGEDATYNAAVGVSGNTTADVFALQLNDGGATFLSDNISIGDLVRNTTDDTITHIAAIVNDTQIIIDDDIFPVGTSSGDGYKITGPVVWTVPDQIGSNDGTSTNMSIQDLQGEAPNYSGAGTSSNMYIEDRVGNAPNSENNALSYNMYPDDIEADVPPTP